MTITVEIGSEVQAELARRAAANGSVAEAHAATLIEEAIRVPILHGLSEDRLANALREIAQYSESFGPRILSGSG